MIHNQKKSVRILVFNIDQEVVRETVVIPDFEWGGQGCLGCDVASGALHRVPPPATTGPNGYPLPTIPPEQTQILDTTYQTTKLDAPPLPLTFNPSESASFPIHKTLTPAENLQPIPGFDKPGDPNEISFLQ